MYMWMGFFELSDWRKSSCATTRERRRERGEEEGEGRGSQDRDRYLSSCPLNMARAKFKEAEKVGDASILKMAKVLNSALEQLYGSCAFNFLAILLPLPCK